MDLLMFPPEIQLQVLRSSVAADFENLVLACKSLHSLAASLIEEHNKQRLQYRTLKLDNTDAQSYSWGKSVPEILYKIAQNPELAQYVVHVDLANQQNLQDAAYYGGAEGFKCEEGEERSKAEIAILSLLQSSDYFSQINPSAEFANEWLARIMAQGTEPTDDDGVDYSTLTLLTLLPNVETLALGYYWSQNSFAETVLAPEEEDHWSRSDPVSRTAPELMELLIKRANDETLRGQPLAKLRILYPTRDVDAQGGDDMVTVMPFLALNSLRELHHEAGSAIVKVKPEHDYCCSLHMPGDDEDHEHGSGSDDDNDGSEAGSPQDDEDEDEGNESGEDEAEDDDDNGDDDEEEIDNDDYYSDGDHEPRRERQDPSYHDRSDYLMHPKYPVLGKNVELIKLDDIVLFEDSCYAMFRDMKKLKTLDINYSAKDEFGTEIEANGIVTALMYCLGATLQTLIISTGEVHPVSDNLLRQSMHDFTALRHLELDVPLFVNGWGSVGVDFMEIDEDEHMSYNGAIEPLLYVLPPCLETFTLGVPCVDVEHLPQLFENFAEERAEHLPNLKTVTLKVRTRDCWSEEFDDAETLVEQVVQFAKDNGLEVEGVEAQDVETQDD